MMLASMGLARNRTFKNDNRSITPIKKGTPIPGGSIVPGNIIQTPQPATVRSVGCGVLILFVIFGIVYIWLNEQNRQQELEATGCKTIHQKNKH